MRAAVTVLALIALAAAPATAQLAIFKGKEPELVFKTETARLDPGIVVVRDESAWSLIAAALEEPPLDAAPDLETSTLLVVVGRDRADSCRSTVLSEVGTRFRKARVTLKEYEPGTHCKCEEQEPLRSVFGVLVGAATRKAVLEEERRMIQCGASGKPLPAPKAPGEPSGPPPTEQILSGTLVDGDPGVSLLESDADYEAFCAEMNQADSCPAVDFSINRVVVAIGKPLQNACRRTQDEGVAVEGTLARVSLLEIHPGKGRMCAQVFGGYQVFAYRVPATVETAELSAREIR